MADCCKVVVAHQGPPGPGVPDGGTTGQVLIKASNADQDTAWGSAGAGMGDVIGPASATNNRLAAFNGATGKSIKDSGILIADIFTVAAAANKVDKVAGKVLSSNDFTDADKAKLNATSIENYRGDYANLIALQTAVPAGNPGDYAYIVTLGVDPVLVVWDSTNNNWHPFDEFQLDGQDVANAIYNPVDAVTWSLADNRRYTQFDKDAVDGAASLAYVNSLALAAGIIAPAYGAINYFNTTGVSVNITSISDGTSNLVVVPSVTTLDPDSTLFDSPVPGRIRFTGPSSRRFVATFNVSFTGPASSEIVITLAKNGSAIGTSKIIQGVGPSSTTQSSSATTQVALSTNDYLEVYIGNLSNTSDPTFKKLAIEISPA